MSKINGYLGTNYPDNAIVILDCPEASVECDEATFECDFTGETDVGSICVFTNDDGVTSQTIDIFSTDGRTKRFIMSSSFIALPFEDRISHMTPVAPQEFASDMSGEITTAYRHLAMPWFYDALSFLAAYVKPLADIDVKKDDEDAPSIQNRFPHEFPADGADGAVLDYFQMRSEKEPPVAAVSQEPAPEIQFRPSGYSYDGEVLDYLP